MSKKRWAEKDIISKGLKNNLKASEPAKNVDTVLIMLPYTMKGMNGSDGLIRMHYTKRKQVKDIVIADISSQVKNISFAGKVRIIYTRFSSKYMDWDNFCSSFKQIGDALKDCKIIIDDNPEIIFEFIPKQRLTKDKPFSTVYIEKYENKL